MPSVTMASTTDRPRVFLDVNTGEEPAGRLTIELFMDKTPKTCENFRQLCIGEHAGLSYAKVPFHRVIDEFMVQGGDVVKGDGTGITSIYNGEAFEDEHLVWRDMDAAGLVCSANRGKDTNGSQFFITLEPCPHLSGKHTIFGRLVAGEDTLHRIAKVAVDKDDKPVEPVLVSKCGELERKRKQKRDSIQEAPAVQENLGERGRRRKSDTDDEMDTETPPTRNDRRSRRQSDNVIDEGLRGRPRARSNSRSASNPIVEEDETSDHSVNTMHKRKRSPSPSRHMDRREEGAEAERRRRSLPNQYRDKNNREYGDNDRYRPSPRRNDQNHAAQRDDDRYRPSRERHRDDGRLMNRDDGRLGGGGGGGYDDHSEAPVRFKGRGVMKYRENDRAW